MASFEGDADSPLFTPDYATALVGAGSRNEQIEFRWDAHRTRNVDCRTRFRDVSYDAVDGPAVEFDDAGLQHALARSCPMIVQEVERRLGLAPTLGLPLLHETFGVLDRGGNILLGQGRSDSRPCQLEPYRSGEGRLAR